MPHSADELLRRHARLLSERVLWESHWAEVAQHVLPRADCFIGRRYSGEKHTEKSMKFIESEGGRANFFASRVGLKSGFRSQLVFDWLQERSDRTRVGIWLAK